MKKLLCLVLLQIIAPQIYSQIFLNGNFENNTVTSCLINVNNSTFNSSIFDVKGIGLGETLDIFYDADCSNYGNAQSGHYYLSVENNSGDTTQSTIFSMKLADTLLINTSYSFSYYDRGIGLGYGPAKIGVSNNDSTFGTLIYTSPVSNTYWTMRTVTFISPITARYVTVKYGPPGGGIMLDNFGGAGISTGIDEEKISNTIFEIYPNPATYQLNIQTNKKFNFKICNSFGQIVKTGASETDLMAISTTDLTNGIYCLEISVNNQRERKYFIIEK